MQRVSSLTMSSAKHASAHAVQVCAQSKHSSMQRTRVRSSNRAAAVLVRTISATWVIAILVWYAGAFDDEREEFVEEVILAPSWQALRLRWLDAGVWELDPVVESAANGDRCLRLVRSVVAVLEPQPVPVHGRLEIAVVHDVDA